MPEIDYSDEALEKLDYDRLVLEGNERVWVRKIGDLFIIDNVPLSEKYRLHDAVNSKGGIVHRRWTSLIRFYYKVAAPMTEESVQARRALCALVKTLGTPTFMFEGLGALHSTAATKEDVERTRNELIAALESLGMSLGEEMVEPLESILDPDLSRFVKATE